MLLKEKINVIFVFCLVFFFSLNIEMYTFFFFDTNFVEGGSREVRRSEQVSKVVVMVVGDTCSEKKRVGAHSRRRSASH